MSLPCGDGQFVFSLLMPLIFGLMMSEFVLSDQLLLRGVGYGFLFEIERTLI